MAKTKSEMFTLIGTNLPDNTTGAITPALLREVTTQLADSMLYAAAGVKEVELLSGYATASQLPTALVTPLQVTFGAAQLSASDPVSLSAAGLLTFNTAGAYVVRVRLQCGRVAATGVATIVSRVLLSGAQLGVTTATRLDTASTIIPVESRLVINATAGQTLAVQVARDSADSSINAGGLYNVTAVTSGWAIAPSALISVSRLEAVT